jgi:hypothetical protein
MLSGEDEGLGFGHDNSWFVPIERACAGLAMTLPRYSAFKDNPILRVNNIMVTSDTLIDILPEHTKNAYISAQIFNDKMASHVSRFPVLPYKQPTAIALIYENGFDADPEYVHEHDCKVGDGTVPYRSLELVVPGSDSVLYLNAGHVGVLDTLELATWVGQHSVVI